MLRSPRAAAFRRAQAELARYDAPGQSEWARALARRAGADLQEELIDLALEQVESRFRTYLDEIRAEAGEPPTRSGDASATSARAALRLEPSAEARRPRAARRGRRRARTDTGDGSTLGATGGADRGSPRPDDDAGDA